MRIESFQSLCELRAIRLFSSKGADWDDSQASEKAEELASTLSEKYEDYGFYYDIAITAVKAVFATPKRYTRLLKKPVESKKDKQLAEIGA